MKKSFFFLVLLLISAYGVNFACAEDQPTVYVIKKGDTLWGLSERFIRDPYYWPNMWANNSPEVANPHFIFPGQKLKIYPDRIEIVTEPATAERAAALPPAKKTADEPTAEKIYTTNGGEGFLVGPGFKPAGFVISTYQNRQMVGQDDIVYVDLGKKRGVKVGDRFSIFKKMEDISHPVTNRILGSKVVPLGTLQLSEIEEKVSKAIITDSFMEISPGAFVIPYRDRKRDITLKPAERDFSGFIVETKTGNAALAAGDIAFLDLGTEQGMEPGVMLYVVRDVVADQKFVDVPIGKLPRDVIGALVVVETQPNTSTAIIIKSIDTVYRGDRVEAKKGK